MCSQCPFCVSCNLSFVQACPPSWPEETLTPSVKNTTMHLSGRNFTLQAKSGRHSKTPGLHLSAVAEETTARLTSGTRSQRDSFLPRSPVPHPEGTGGDVGPLPLMLAPMKLAPLQLPKEKKKTTDMQSSCSARMKALNLKAPAPAQTLPPTEPPKDSQRPPGNHLVRAGHAEQTAERHLPGHVVCRGAPASTMHTKPSPPSSSAKSSIPTGQKPPGAAAPLETGRRHLRRPRPMEEGRSHDIAATGDPKSPHPTAPKDQRAERALRNKRDIQRQDHWPPAEGRTAVAHLQVSSSDSLGVFREATPYPCLSHKVTGQQAHRPL